MKVSNEWGDILSALTADTPADELEADIVLADIAGKLSAERIKRGMSQQEFAKLLGVNQSRISKMESGECNFSVRRLIQIAHRLSIPFKIQFGEKPILQSAAPYASASPNFHTGNHAAYSNVISFPHAYCNANYGLLDLKEN